MTTTDSPSIVDRYRGGQWEPMHGWLPDEDVEKHARRIIVDDLGGAAEDIPVDLGLPEGIGGAVCIGWDDDGGAKMVVSIGEALPADIRADLWTFGLALGAALCEGEIPAGWDDVFYIGTERRPVTAHGVGLLAHMLLRRSGRDSRDVDFPVFRNNSDHPVDTTHNGLTPILAGQGERRP